MAEPSTSRGRPRKCRYCRTRPADHLADGRCADGSGRAFAVTVKGADSRGMSFGSRQIAAVDQLFRVARGVPALAVLLRSPELIAVERKFLGMRQKLRQQAGRDRGAA